MRTRTDNSYGFITVSHARSRYCYTCCLATLYGLGTTVRCTSTALPRLCWRIRLPYFTHKCAGCNTCICIAPYRISSAWPVGVARGVCRCGDFLPSVPFCFILQVCPGRRGQRQPTRHTPATREARDTEITVTLESRLTVPQRLRSSSDSEC